MPIKAFNAIKIDSLVFNTSEKDVNFLNFKIYYYVDRYDIVEDLLGNRAELQKVQQFIERSFSDNQLSIKTVKLVGICSIEGSFEHNEKLAIRRTNGLQEYLLKHSGYDLRYVTFLTTVIEDWDYLRKQVSDSSLPTKDKILAIINSNIPSDDKEAKLKALEGGSTYKYLEQNFFPESRRVDIRIEYTTPTVPPPTVEVPVVVPIPPQTEPEVAEEAPEAIPQEYDYFPVWAVKTNLLQWAGVPYPFVYRTYLPNVSLEYYFAKRWSIHADAAYGYHTYDDGDKFQGIASYGAEVRWWLKNDRRFRGLYAGIYGLAGDYDYQKGRIDNTTTYTNHTGKHWGTGLSVGYMLPFNIARNQFCVEFGLHGGYRHYYNNTYDRELPHNYYNYRTDANKWGITGASINIVYRFNHQENKVAR